MKYRIKRIGKKYYPHVFVKGLFFGRWWAIVKRGMVGQFHKVSKKYLQNYLDEFCFRFNNRNNKNAFNRMLIQMVV